MDLTFLTLLALLTLLTKAARPHGPTVWRKAALVFAALSLGALGASPAFATLGEKADTSVDKVRQAYHGSRHQSVVGEKFTVHEIANDGLTVREYAGSDGVVFAVAWDGINHPDLAPLLGTYLDEYAKAASDKAPRTARIRRSEVSGPNVTVIKFGHMRSVHGKAYIKSLLPQGVTPDDVK